MSMRTYRHVPWLVASTVVLLIDAGWIGALLYRGFADPSYEYWVKAVLFLLPLGAFAYFLVGQFRVRTVIDDEAVTQHWITKSFRIPLHEITGMEMDEAGRRFFLRVFRGEETYELIPCHTVLAPFAVKAPRALVRVEAELHRLTGAGAGMTGA